MRVDNFYQNDLFIYKYLPVLYTVSWRALVTVCDNGVKLDFNLFNISMALKIIRESYSFKYKRERNIIQNSFNKSCRKT